jgi:hypothetical protein
MQPAEAVRLLHRAAEKIDGGAMAAEHQWLADAGGKFMEETDFADENALPVRLDPRSAIGYGIMVGWIARGIAIGSSA